MSAPTIDRLEGVRPVVELGVGTIYDDASTARWDVALWDDPAARWAGDQPMWADITCHVMDVQTSSGRERSLDLFDVGTATITCENADGWADYPTSIPDLADDWSLLAIRPGRSIRVGVAALGQPPVFLWGGYVDEANPNYEAGVGPTMTFECIDALGDAGRVELATLAAPAGAGETATARIARILNAGSWPSYRRALDASNVAVRATTLGAQTIDLLGRATESVGGEIYGDLGSDTSDPRVAFRGRDWASWDTDDEPLGTIGNYGIGRDELLPLPIDEDPDASGLWQPLDGYGFEEDPAGSGLLRIGWVINHPDTCPNGWELMFDRAGITTRAILGRDSEVEHVYNDASGGIPMFGIETYKRGDLETDVDAELNWLGARVLAVRSWRYMPRIAACTITAAPGHPETIATLLQASPFVPARFRCQHRYESRVVFNRIMMVTGVQHSISPEQWQARIALDDATPYLVKGTQPARWDEAGVALWDAATWSAPT